MNAPIMPMHLLADHPLLPLLNHAQEAEDGVALDFIAVNDSHLLAPYRQAALWLADGGVTTLSGVASVERNAPYVLWLQEACTRLAAAFPDQASAVTADDLPGPLASNWDEWLPAWALWVPLALPGAKGVPVAGLLFARDQEWTEAEAGQIAQWLRLWLPLRHALSPLTQRRRWHGVLHLAARRRRFAAAVAGVLAILTLVPVPISIISPAELVAAEPMPVRAPLDGVVRQFFVQPNQAVRAGQPLFEFDILQLNAKLNVAQQALQSAEAELRQYDQQALSDAKARAALAAARGNVAEKRAELDYLTGQRGRAQVKAQEDGMAIFDDPQEWIGKPVSTGERILRIASENKKEIEAWVPAADAIPLPASAGVKLYLSASPLDPVAGTVRYVAHDAVRRPDGGYAYRVRAVVDGDTPHRIGLKGTARLSGERVALGYWMFRRPLAAIREFLGV